jgi:hypothetical protein
VSENHAEQGRLADTGAGKDAESLAAPYGGQSVDRTNAELEPFGYGRSAKRRRRRASERAWCAAWLEGPTVNRLTQTVENPSKECIAARVGFFARLRDEIAAHTHATKRAKGHQESRSPPESDDFGGYRTTQSRDNIKAIANRSPRGGPLDDQARNTAYSTDYLRPEAAFELLGERFECLRLHAVIPRCALNQASLVPLEVAAKL